MFAQSTQPEIAARNYNKLLIMNSVSGLSELRLVLFLPLVLAGCAFLPASSNAQDPSRADGPTTPRKTPAQADPDPTLMSEVQITSPGFEVKLAFRSGVVGSLNVLVPAIHKEAVTEEQGLLEEILRKEIQTSPLRYKGYCSETPWLLQGDHSELSLGVGLFAARLITKFNEALGADLVWGFKCDLWNYERRPILKDGVLPEFEPRNGVGDDEKPSL